ncbi:hypothetical protein HK104_002511 [Borealophlyctis nickersoniae]|nr:hypothetical protein HK104_002511 [Borealophlyctis nickersoniae]
MSTSEKFTQLVARAKAVDASLQQTYSKRHATVSAEHQQVMEGARQVWSDVFKRVEAATRLIQESELLGLSLEAAISSKEELVVLWEVVEAETGALRKEMEEHTLNAEELKKLQTRTKELEKQLADLQGQLQKSFQTREILVSRLVAHNVTNKLARLAIPSLTEPKKAIGYTLASLRKAKKADQTVINDNINRYSDLESGLDFLFNAGLQVAHPKELVTPDGKAVVLTDTVLENCLKGAFGENHPEYSGMMSVLKLLKDLAGDLKDNTCP